MRVSLKTAFWTVLCLLIALWSCKSSETPTVPKPTTSSITVNASSDMFFIGTVEVFTAVATMSDGSTKAVVGGVWGVDWPNVATVESSTGKVTIVGSGTCTVYVDYEGKRGTKLIRGLPNYQGTWSGTYTPTSCSYSGSAFKAICSEFTTGSVWPTKLTLTQEKDRVTGRFYLGLMGADASGPVATDGTLSLSGAIKEGSNTIDVSWKLQSTTPGKCTGSLTQLWYNVYYPGSARVEANIRDLNRTSTVETWYPAKSLPPNATVQDAIDALRGF